MNRYVNRVNRIPNNNIENVFKYEKKKSKRFEIIEMSKSRIAPQLDLYVHALESASSKILQNRIPLYDNYLQTLMIDDVVASLLDKRLENILNKDLVVYNKDGEQIDIVNEFIKSPRFADFLKDLVMTKFWGFNVFEFDEIEWQDQLLFEYKLMPHKHINPYTKEVLKHQNDARGESFENSDDYLMVGNPDDLGLLSKITYLSILNRLGTFNWSNYSDLASNNFLTIKGKGYSDDDELENMQLEYMQSANKGSLYLPEGVDVDFTNQTSSQQNALFENYSKMVRERLSILVLGNTMTTQDGSSRSQAEVHSDQQNMKYTADEIYVENILNYEFKDYLNLWLDIDTKDIYFKFNPSTDQEIAEKLNNFNKLKELGVLFTDEELRNHFKDLIK